MKNLLFTSFLSCIAFLSLGQNTNISGIINTYTSVTSISGTTITVGSSAGYSVGDQILIIQMQGATIDQSNSGSFGNITSIGDAGNYEFATICSIPNGTQIVVNNIQRTYSVSGVVQVVSVPIYDDATVTATLTAVPWDGTIGGILAFECLGNLTLNSEINLNGVGFRGGGISTSIFNCSWTQNINDFFYNISSGEGAKKGEGVALYIPGKTGGKGAQANGGGGSNDHNGGGGGGGNAGSGGLGGERIGASTFTCKCTNPGIGGKANSYSNTLNKIFLGGGGGSGHENNVGEGSGGSNGGGIVVIKANGFNGNGQTINANGGLSPIDCFDGAGGGGAGGTVLLDVTSYIGAVNINTQGTNGGSVNGSGSSNCNGPGGGGSGGVLWVNQNAVPTNVTYSSTGGQSGITLSASQSNCIVGGANGATSGNGGTSLTSLTLVENSCNIQSSVTATICGSDSLFVGGAWQTSAGIYYDTISSACCDSFVETSLSVVPNFTSTLNQTICAGESIVVNGTTYDTSVAGAIETFTNVGTSGCDSIVTINLTVLAPLTGTLNETICEGESIVVNGTIYDATITGATEIFTNIGSSGCDSTVTINLTVNALDNSVTDSSPTLTANAVGVNYQWLICPELTAINGEIAQSFTATVNGLYAVVVTLNACSDTSSCIPIGGLGFIENDFGDKCTLFPNPTDGNFSIDLGEVYPAIKITIIDLSGKVVQSTAYSGSQLLNLKLDAPAGIYTLRIESEDKRAIVRLVKE